MTNSEIAKKVKETFRKGDKVYFSDLIYLKGWFIIESISPTGEIIATPTPAISGIKTLKFSGLDALNFLSFEEYVLLASAISQKRPKKNGDPYEVGDKVWVINSIDGIHKGIITRHLKTTKDVKFALIYETEEGTKHERFISPEGKYFSWHKLPSVFHQKPILSFE